MFATIKNKCGTKEKAYAKFRRGLEICKIVSESLPNPKDSIFTKVVKYTSVSEYLYHEIFPKQNQNVYDAYFASKSICGEWVHNLPLSNIVFDTDLTDVLSVEKEIIPTPNEKERKLSAIKISNPKIGTIVFFEDTLFSPVKRDWFVCAEGFNMSLFLDCVWEKYDKAIHIEKIHNNIENTNKTQICKITNKALALSGKSKDKLDFFISRYNKYVTDKIPRTFLFNGPPGSGKSTFAIHFAKTINKKVLRMDANIVSSITASDLDFLLDGLCPDIVIIVIIDDIDRVNGLSNASPTLFSIFTDMKDKHPGVIIILTTNNKYKLPDALLRPGRIDEIIEFEHLDFEPRKEIFQSYINHHNVNIDYNLDDIVKEAVGLTAAYIKEIVIQMKYQSKKDVLKLVSRMRDISGVKAESPECSNSSNEPANEPANEPMCETCDPIGKVPSIT